MFTIALDEQGDFENLKGKISKEPVFIGGIIYDDIGDPNDYVNEKNRLEAYFKRVCKSAKATYPKDLHYSTEGGSNNGEKVHKVKKVIGETIKEFLEEGTWNKDSLDSKHRKGKYYIFVSIRGENGKCELLEESVSEVVRENFASNLYIHMAEDVIERILFHNPVIPQMDKVRLELATRRVVLTGTERLKKMEEYIKLGYSEVQRPTNQRHSGESEYILTNSTNYRTAIEREMLHSKNKSTMMIDRIGVKSIYYDRPRKGMEFLYLADVICSHLSYNNEGREACDWIKAFNNLSNSINEKSRNLIWGYDEADEYFMEGWKLYETRDYYNALSCSFEGTKCTSSMKDYYTKEWYPMLLDAIKKDASLCFIAYEESVKKFKSSIMNNNVNQEKLVYIYEALALIGKSIVFSNKKEKSCMYDIYDAGVSVYTHIGDSKKAEECYKKTREYAEYVPIEIYLRTRNRMIVYLCDKFEFKEALVIASENISYHIFIEDMRKKIFDNCYNASMNYAIALSQRAQIYAFMGNKLAEKDFLNALNIMDKCTPDYLITESYLLHYYIMMNDKEKYEKYAEEFFGGETNLVCQFNYLVVEGARMNARFSMKYAFYLYVKSLYVFYLEIIPTKLINKLMDIDNALETLSKYAKKEMNGHPWEIIYKYIVLVLRKCGDSERVKGIEAKYIKRIKLIFDDSEGIIHKIAKNSLIECGEIVNDVEIDHNKYMYMYT